MYDHYHICSECDGEWPCEAATCEPDAHGFCYFVCRDCRRATGKADAYRICRRQNEVV